MVRRVEQQVVAHEETSSLLRSYDDGGENALPVVERHLDMIKGAAQSPLDFRAAL